MLNWLFSSKVLATIIAHTFVMSVAVIGFLLYSWLFGLPSFVANAAPPATSDNCVLVATVEGIDTYFCESDYGSWKQNDLGFMLPGE